MPVIQLEALDTLFFRDGKPFTMGEDNFAEGAFPPSPSVIYGALRTAYMAQNLGKNGKTVDDLIRDTEGLVITDIAFQFDNQLCYPMPLDYVERKAKENEAICLSLIENLNSDLNTPYLCCAKEHVEQVSDGVFAKFQLENYLDGNTINADISKWSSMIMSEHKFGNSRNNDTRSTSDDDGNVYRVGMRRLENKDFKQLKFIVEYKLDNEIKNGLMRLGGEGKAVEIKNSNIAKPQAEQLSDKYFKIVLQTPALFDNGNEPNLQWFSNNGFEVRLLTKVVGKPVKIGGWDMLTQNPKRMLSATPTGSVFYYEITNDKTVNDFIVDSKIEYSISDQRQAEGFGLFKIANLNFNPIQI
jgi:CRISPR-associated protein Cmr3